MTDNNFDGLDAQSGPEKTEILPASAAGTKPSTQVLLRSGVGKPSFPARAMAPMAVFKSFRRRWALATGLGAVCALLVGFTAYLIVPAPKYSTTAYLQVATHQPRIIFDVKEQLADYRTFQKTQMELIKSPVVLDPVLRDPRVASLALVKEQADPSEWLLREIQVGFQNGSEILLISMSGATPNELKPIIDTVVSAYIEHVVDQDHKSRVDRLERLHKLYSQYQEELKSRRTSIRQLTANVGSDDRMTLAMRQGFQVESLHMLEKERIDIRSQLRRLTSFAEVIEVKQKEAASVPPTAIAAYAPGLAPAARSPLDKQQAELAREAAIEARIMSHPEVAKHRKNIAIQNSKIVQLGRLARDRSDPALQAVRLKRADAVQDHEAARAQVREELLARMSEGQAPNDALAGNGNNAGMKSHLDTLRDSIEVHTKHEAAVQAEIDTLSAHISKFSTQALDLVNEQNDIDITGATTQKIGSEIEGLEVELQAPRRINKLTDAGIPRQKDHAKQYLMCGGASFGAFALAIMAVTFLELKTMRIESVSEVVTDLGIPLVGALPALPGRGGKVSKAEDQRWQGLLVESIDATRTMLLHAARVNSTRAVLITSAMKGEGKTSLAAHLATSLARAGRKTLLIDCDLRRPTLHQLFDVQRVPGLCELLRGEAELNDVIRPTPADDLNLLPAGVCDGLALQAIAQDGVRDVLVGLKKRYDFIIIDSAPVLPVVDTMLISQQVDAVLFSVMREVSRVPLVQAAHERLASLGVKVLGAVVSGAERRDYMHSYDYEYQMTETA